MKLQALFQGFYEYDFRTSLHFLPLYNSTFAQGDNEQMLMNSCYFVINPGAQTNLTLDQAMASFSGIE
jgi:hypothetical protein